MAKTKPFPFQSALESARTYGYLHSGNYALNYVITGRLQRGWPLGHVVEIFGGEATGKSYLILNAITQAQRAGGCAFMDDTEGALNTQWATNHLGVDVEELGWYQSVTVNDHYEAAGQFLDWLKETEKTPAVLALDSIAVLTTEHELATAFAKTDMTRAKEVRMLFRVLKKKLRNTACAYLITNHTIANIGGFGPQETTPTGSGLKFHAGLRLHLRQPTRIRDPKTRDYLGVVVKAFVEKNRFGVPWRECRMAIPFYENLNPMSGLIPVLLDLGFLSLGGNDQWLQKDGESLGIRAYKSDFLRQDDSALHLVEKFPELLEEADTFIGDQEAQIRLMGGEVLEDEDAG